MANSSSENNDVDANLEMEVWWETSDEANRPLPPFLSDFPQLAHEVADNLALAVMGRMCRKGMGWDFPSSVYVDPRMKDAEYTVDKEEEVEKLSEILSQIENDVPAHRRPASLLAFHCALRDAYKELAEPEDGTPWEDIEIGHKCLDREWFSSDSHPSLFGLTNQYVEVWCDTVKAQELLFSAQPPPAQVVQTLLEIRPLLLEEKDITQTPFGNFF